MQRTPLRLILRAAASAAALSAASPARAQESAPGAETVTPGPQASPPGAAGAQPAPLVHDPRERWAIRGCPIGDRCHGEIIAGLREFEAEAFPRRGESPWIESDDVDGRGAALAPRKGSAKLNGRPAGAEIPTVPSWLAELTLPDIPFEWDERVVRYLEFYRDDPRGRAIMSAWLTAQDRYRHLIARELRRAKLPDALLYIPMIESSYDPHEYSRVGASGLWQFMPAGGRIYGLRQDRWLDERNDPVLSTRAAAVYFADLYQRFGDWSLALAAYNAGYGAVLKGIAKYNTNDFWTLLDYENALPWESSMYVPKFFAAAIVGLNRETFGFSELEGAEPLRWDHVKVPTSVPLAVVARAAGVTLEEIRELNPQLRRDRTPPGIGDYVLRVPEGRAGLFSERFPQLRGDWDEVVAYVVRHGERFEDVATTYGISRSKLRSLNGLDSESEVRGGMILVVPRIDKEAKEANRERAEADLYVSGVPEGSPGEPLMVAVPDPGFRVDGRAQHFYRVVGGDSLYAIATAFGVDWKALAAWNGLDEGANLHPRMVLQVWADPAFDPSAKQIKVLDPQRIYTVRAGSEEHLNEAERRVGRRRVVYRPTRAESFEKIGKKYGLTEWDLARINKKPPSTVAEPDEEVLVYEVVDASQSERAAEQKRASRSR